MLALSAVEKRFGSKVALQPATLDFPDGTTTALIGESGCGKSTLLRVIVGLELADGGEIRFDEVALIPSGLMAMRRRIGYVIQDGGLFPHLTGRQNVALLARHVGWSEDRVGKRIDELTQLSRLPGDLLDRYPLELSGGQRQRVSLMRALMLDPPYLFLDEPLGAIDPVVRNELQTDLRGIFRELKKTVVIVTHDLGEAAYLGDRIVLMRGGAIVQIGSLSELKQRPANDYVTQFLAAQRSHSDGDA